MSKESIQQHINPIAVIIAFALFMVAVIRFPVGLGQGRDFILGLFQVGVLIVFFAALWKINKWVALLLLLAIISRTVPTITLESQHALKCILFGLGWYFFVYHFGNTKLLMDAMCVIAFAHFLATFVQWLNIPSLFSGAVCGLTFNPNEGATLFALCFPAFLQEDRKKYLLIIFAGLAMVHSFGGALAVTVGLIFWGCMSGYYPITIPCVIALGLFWWCVDIPSASARWIVWENAFNMYLPNWKWGCGLGHWETISQELVRANIQLLPGNSLAWTRLHNTFLNGLMEMGIGFVFVLTGFFIHALRQYSYHVLIPYTALIVAIVVCNTNSVFRMNALNGMIIVTWLAILEVSLHVPKNQANV